MPIDFNFFWVKCIEFYMYKFILLNVRFTEIDHVKTNLVHKIHRIPNFGTLKLQEFQNLLSSDDYAKCKKNTHWLHGIVLL